MINKDPSPGLILSMCLRHDHGFFMQRHEMFPGFFTGSTDLDKEQLQARMREFYSFVYNMVTDKSNWPKLTKEQVSIIKENFPEITVSQIYEEMSLQGFYREDKEKLYTEDFQNSLK